MNFKQAHEKLKKLANGQTYSIEYGLSHRSGDELTQEISVHIRLDNDDFLHSRQHNFESALGDIAYQLKGKTITENLEKITDDLKQGAAA